MGSSTGGSVSVNFVGRPYTIRYEANWPGGTGVSTQGRTYGTATTLTVPAWIAQRPGYYFAGWSGNSAGTDFKWDELRSFGEFPAGTFSAPTTNTQTYTLFAQWELARDKVFTLHGIDGATQFGSSGWYSAYDTLLPTHQMLIDNNLAVARRAAGFTLVGWSFDPLCNMPGWSGSLAGGQIFTMLPMSSFRQTDLILYAVWR
jgi:hypothetical protein